MTDLFTWSSLVAVLMLTLMEIVLGIDNIVFIAILTDRLPRKDQPLARRLGLAMALVTRLLLLFAISWIMGMVHPWWEGIILGHHLALTGQSLVLFLGGGFLIYKSAHEIYLKTEGVEETEKQRKVKGIAAVVVQIAILDIVFSLDSIITAVGMVGKLPIMITAIVIAIAIMIVFADKVSQFINNKPSIKILALAFLLLIGTLLTAEALEFAVPKGYVYFAMAFAMFIELLDMRRGAKRRKKLAEQAKCPHCGENIIEILVTLE